MLGLKQSLGIAKKKPATSAVASFENTYSLAFDGSNDRLLMGNATFDIGSYAIWIKTTETGGTIVMQKDAGWYFYYNSGKMKVQHPMISGTLNSTTFINDDSWHFLTVTCAGGSGVSSEVKFYIDGSLETTKAGPGTPNTYTATTDALSIAYSDVWNGYYFEGNLDEPSFWTNVLTSDEVTALYNSGEPIDLQSDSGNYESSATLQHWWRMGDPDGTSEYPTIEDVDGSLDGTMTNMTSGDIVSVTP